MFTVQFKHIGPERVFATLALSMLAAGPVHATTESNQAGDVPVVSVVRTDDGFGLNVNGAPFIIRGAGTVYHTIDQLATLADAGGNTFRTWDTRHLDEQLDAAETLGLKILVGLEFGKQLQGFDYDDARAVEQQHQALMQEVQRYRQHPAILGWIIANEPNLMIGSDGGAIPVNPRVYDALGALVDDIHAVDPTRPVTFSLAFTPFIEQDIATTMARAPNVDIISLQAYGALAAIPDLIRSVNIDKPFMVTEFGPLGHWEMPATAWGREIEESSGPKADGMVARMQNTLLQDATGQLVGSFVFLWGQKQERTPTWYGLFTEAGGRTAGVDEMTRLWRGEYPANRAPRAQALSLQGGTPHDNITLQAGSIAEAHFDVADAENDDLSIRWELMEEVDERSAGGHFEATPATLPLVLRDDSSDEIAGTTLTFKAPQEPGHYRLYAYATDADGGEAYANFPFRVTQAADAR